MFPDISETLLDTYAPLKRLLSKPWIAHGIMTSIKNKDKIYKKLLKSRHPQQKERLCNEFKRYRNSINIISRNSKTYHYQNFSQEHKQNMLKTWESIKSIININTTENKFINCFNVGNIKETDPFVLNNSFNKFFTTIAKKKTNIVHTSKNYKSYLNKSIRENFLLNSNIT